MKRLSETQEHVLTLLYLKHSLCHYQYMSPSHPGGFLWVTRKWKRVRKSTMLALRRRGLVIWDRHSGRPARVTLTPAGLAALKEMEDDQ